MLILVIATVIVVLSLVALNVKYSQERPVMSREEEAYYDLSATKVTAENIEGVLSFQYNKAMEGTSKNHPAIQSQRQ